MPWCPNCREEYRPGFETCSDCGAKLVDVLPPLAENGAAAGNGIREIAAESDWQTDSGKKDAEYHRRRAGKRRPSPADDALWCPRCRAEYRRGFKLCGDCGVELVATPPEFDEEDETEKNGDNAKPFCDAFLTTVAGRLEAALLETRLNDGGIPVAKAAGGSGVDIYVPSELMEEAWDVVDSLRELVMDGERPAENTVGAQKPVPPAPGGSGRLWCPSCRVEYWQEGATVCRDCGAKLMDPKDR